MTDEHAVGQIPTDASESMTLEEALRIIKELRRENAQRRTTARDLESKMQQREEQELAEKHQWEKLAQQYKAELDDFRKRAEVADQLELSLKETLDARIKALPKQFQASVPDLGSPDRTLKWLDANANLFKMPTPPPTNAGEQGDNAASAVITDEIRALAKQLGISDAKAMEYMKRRN